MRVIFSALLVLGLSVIGAFASSHDAACVRERLIVKDPVLVEIGDGRATIRMNMTNNLSWVVKNVYLRFIVMDPSTRRTLLQEVVSLTIPNGLPRGESEDVQTPSFELPGDKLKQALVSVTIEDVADPSGDQVVHSVDIIGLGWTGRESKMGCN